MNNFAAIDFETANYNMTSICSIGIVVVREGTIVERIHRLVKPAPNYYLARFSNEIHGIYYQDTADKPLFPDVWDEIAPSISGLELVAHNKAFDENVLRKTFDHYNMPYPNYIFHCTYQTARKRISKQLIENYRLPTVCKYLGIEFSGHHNALFDAEGCAGIALRIL